MKIQSGLRILTSILYLFCSGCLTFSETGADESFQEFTARSRKIYLQDKLKAHPEGRGFALLIGIDDDNYAFSSELSTPLKEVGSLKKILEKNGYAVKTLLNEQATRDNILSWVDYFSAPEISRRPNSFILYYAGHGLTLGTESLEKGFDFTQDFHQLTIKLQKMYSSSEDKDSLEYTDCEKLQDFYMLCYQDSPSYNSQNEQKISSLVGNHEIMQRLKKARFGIKAELINACAAPGTVIKMPASPSVYYYSLERQGFLFFCMLKDVVMEKDFSPAIYSGLLGDADNHGGNKDGVVTVFELINYTNGHWKNILKKRGMKDNNIKYVIYCSEDIPLTVY